jgi:hypothetical protein
MMGTRYWRTLDQQIRQQIFGDVRNSELRACAKDRFCVASDAVLRRFAPQTD